MTTTLAERENFFVEQDNKEEIEIRNQLSIVQQQNSELEFQINQIQQECQKILDAQPKLQVDYYFLDLENKKIEREIEKLEKQLKNRQEQITQFSNFNLEILKTIPTSLFET